MPNLTVPPEAVNGSPYFAIVAKAPIYKYSNGKRVSEDPIGYRISTLCPGSRYAALAVRIDSSKDPLPDLAEEDIDKACRDFDPFIVRFSDDCKISLYTIDGQMRMSGTASGVQLVDQNK